MNIIVMNFTMNFTIMDINEILVMFERLYLFIIWEWYPLSIKKFIYSEYIFFHFAINSFNGNLFRYMYT